ncbi:hypothetical protein C2E23DRAFT_862132 [Lenzites betulinus]|nr:hypothetical protein C2E23DRAFT_862132 [Lenzites betulinus]
MEYDLSNYKLRAIVREHDAKETGAKIVRQVMSPLLSRLPYFDPQALKEHCQSGTSTAIFSSAVLIRELPPIPGYKKRAHLMNAIYAMIRVPGDGKIWLSDAHSRVDLLDTPDAERRKNE